MALSGNSRPPRYQRILLISLVAALVAATSILAATGEWKSSLESFNRWAAEVGPLGMAVYVLVYTVCTLLLIPGSILTLGGAYAFGFWKGLVLVTIGANVGSLLAFLVGRHFFREKIERQMTRWPQFQRIDASIAEEGWKIVMLVRLSPVIPFMLSNYAFGLTRVHWFPYLWSSFIGMIPGTLFYVYLGYAGRTIVEGEHRSWVWAWRVTGLLATLGITWYMARWAKKRLKT